jgi:hypothetical protein
MGIKTRLVWVNYMPNYLTTKFETAGSRLSLSALAPVTLSLSEGSQHFGRGLGEMYR